MTRITIINNREIENLEEPIEPAVYAAPYTDLVIPSVALAIIIFFFLAIVRKR